MPFFYTLYIRLITALVKLFLPIYFKYINYLITKLAAQDIKTFSLSEMELTAYILQSLIYVQEYIQKQLLEYNEMVPHTLNFEQIEDTILHTFFKAYNLIHRGKIAPIIKFGSPHFRVAYKTLKLAFWRAKKHSLTKKQNEKKINVITNNYITTPEAFARAEVIRYRFDKIVNKIEECQKAEQILENQWLNYKRNHRWLSWRNEFFKTLIFFFDKVVTSPSSIALLLATCISITSLLYVFTCNEESVIISSLFLAFIILYNKLSNVLWKFFNTLINSFIHLNFQKISYANILLIKTKTKEKYLKIFENKTQTMLTKTTTRKKNNKITKI